MIAGLYDNFKHWHISGTVWVISDTHFGDKELAAGIPGRPDDETLVKLINSKVGKNDTLIHLGDCGDIEYIKKLKGYKVLIAGNHDKGMNNYKDIFKMVFSGPVMIGPKLILSHEPVNVPWAFNLHGHNHDPKHKNDSHHFNCNLDAIGYCPINLNQWMKQGYLSRIEDIHRQTINTATVRSRNRRNK